MKTAEKNLVVLICEVMHSMRVNEKNLQTWVIFSNESRKVVTAHCTCTAGLGECCSHSGALLFYVLFATSKRSTSVTDELAYWILPCTTSVEQSRISKINYTKPRLHKRKNSEHIKMEVKTSVIQHPMKKITDPTAITFLKGLEEIRPNSAVLKVVRPFNEKFKVVEPRIPLRPLQASSVPSISDALPVERILNFELLRESFVDDVDSFFMLTSCSLQQQDIYNSIIKVQADDACRIFRTTKGQSNSMWHMHRQLRFTGCISYALFTFAEGELKKNEQRDWVAKFEGTIFSDFQGNIFTRNGHAGEESCKRLLKEKFSIFYDKIGFYINTECPWFGFSPDCIYVQNNQNVLVEIKTPDCGQSCSCINPKCGRNKTCAEFNEKTVKCLVRKGENITLRKKHPYYGQIQLGLYLLGLRNAVLILYSECEDNFRTFPVLYDPKFCEGFIKTLSELYFKKFLPFLVEKKSNQLKKFAACLNKNIDL